MFITGEEIAQDFVEQMIKECTQKDIENGEYEYHKNLIKEDPNLLILERYQILRDTTLSD